MLDDAESMIRISRALACLNSDPEEDIFSKEFSEKWYNAETSYAKNRLHSKKGD